MLGLALFIGAQLVELPPPPPAPARLPELRFVAEGGLGEHIQVHLPAEEPAPTPSVRVLVEGGGEHVEIEGTAGGWFGGALAVGFPRTRLSALARYDGVLTVRAWVVDGEGGWRATGARQVRSRAIPQQDATAIERMMAVSVGTPRAAVRRAVGRPTTVRGREDWYGDNRLVFDAADRFMRWDPLGC